MSDAIVIPPPRTEPLRQTPRSAIFFGTWKVGKTTAIAALLNTLILLLRPGGADYVKRVWAKETLTKEEFVGTLEYLKAQRAAGTPVAQRIVVDDIGQMDDWLFDLALDAFFATPSGRTWKANGLKRITDLPGHGDKQGSPGWAWYWEQLSIMHHRLLMAADEIIYIGHVRDKAVATKAEVVIADDLDLTGLRARKLFCGQVSCIGFMFRREAEGEDQLVVSFKTNDKIVCGSSVPGLSGKEFVIGRSKNGEPPVFDWKEIYPV